MTALQMQHIPHFPVPVTEDPMELTPDTDQRAGDADDIDIDFDLNGENPDDGEDEFMGEEDINASAYSTYVARPDSNVGNDDEMADDGYAQVLADAESPERNENIEDAGYTGPELDEDTTVEPGTDHLNVDPEELLANYEEISGVQNHEQDYQEQDLNDEAHDEYPSVPEKESGLIERDIANGQTEVVKSSHDVAKSARRETSEEYHLEIGKEAAIDPGAADNSSSFSGLDGLVSPEANFMHVGEEILPVSSDQEAVAPQSDAERSQAQEQDSLNSLTHLHPIFLDYQGDEMFLFPPVDQSEEHAATFLLADEQLAYSTIGDLLEACRCVLKGSLSEQDELMIDIDDLDLHISESTVECASTRLSEVVTLYVHLQKNDGLENPPPLYMDLTSRNRFSHRLNALRNALIEGTGLSQLKSSQETRIRQQDNNEEEPDPPNHTTVLSDKDAYVSEQQPGENEEGGIDQHDTYGHPLPSETPMLETDSGIQGIQSHPVKDAARKENDLAEPPLGRGSSAHEAENGDVSSGEPAGSEEHLESAQSLAGSSEIQKAVEVVVNDGDFIDYEDVEELEGDSSSASSTLQGDTNDLHAVQDHAAPNKLIDAPNQAPQYPYHVHEDAVANSEIFFDHLEEKDNSDIGVAVDGEYHHEAENPPQNSDDKVQSVSERLDEGGEASENHRDANISQGIQSQLTVDVDDHHEAGSQYEDDEGSYWQGTLHEHADQTEGDASRVADSDFNGEVGDYPSPPLLDSELAEHRTPLNDDDLGRTHDLEAEIEPDETDYSIANNDSDQFPRPLEEEVETRPLLFDDESAQVPEDDDEITYEDEEYDIDASMEPAQANHNVTNVTISPGSLKRGRSLHQDDDFLEADRQGAKRVCLE